MFEFLKIFWGGAHRAPSPDPSPRFFSGFALDARATPSKARALRALGSGFALSVSTPKNAYPISYRHFFFSTSSPACRGLVVEGTRGRGRSRKTWEQCVRDDMKLLGLHPEWAVFRDVEGLDLGQTSNPSLAWKNGRFKNK